MASTMAVLRINPPHKASSPVSAFAAGRITRIGREYPDPRLKPPAGPHDAGDALAILAVIDGEERAAVLEHRGGIAQILVGQAAANADRALDIPGLAAIGREDGADAEIRLAPAIGAEDAAIGKRQEMRRIARDGKRFGLGPAQPLILGEGARRAARAVVGTQLEPEANAKTAGWSRAELTAA